MASIDLGCWQGAAVQPFLQGRCHLSAVLLGSFTPTFLSASRWISPRAERGDGP